MSKEDVAMYRAHRALHPARGTLDAIMAKEARPPTNEALQFGLFSFLSVSTACPAGLARTAGPQPSS